MASVSMKRSLVLDRCKAAARQSVLVLNKERLVRRIAPTKRKEANDVGVEIDLSANESLGPRRIDEERTSEN
ncbi:MAG: hypothetical protein DMF56_06240 [Acidobacteria bacterium]|nr:MAG: hypothetical protein DMF56_06240 [Acidobacteriota bacterium]